MTQSPYKSFLDWSAFVFNLFFLTKVHNKLEQLLWILQQCSKANRNKIVLQCAEPVSFVLILLSAAQSGDLPVLSYRKRKWAVLTSRTPGFKFSLFRETAMAQIPASCEARKFALQKMWPTFSKPEHHTPIRSLWPPRCLSKNKVPVFYLSWVWMQTLLQTWADMQSVVFHMQNCGAVKWGSSCHIFLSKSKPSPRE